MSVGFSVDSVSVINRLCSQLSCHCIFLINFSTLHYCNVSSILDFIKKSLQILFECLWHKGVVVWTKKMQMSPEGRCYMTTGHFFVRAFVFILSGDWARWMKSKENILHCSCFTSIEINSHNESILKDWRTFEDLMWKQRGHIIILMFCMLCFAYLHLYDFICRALQFNLCVHIQILVPLEFICWADSINEQRIIWIIWVWFVLRYFMLC